MSPILRYTLDGVAQVLVEEAGGQEARYLYGLDLLAQQEMASGGKLTYLGYDALSVRLHLDGDGAIAATYRYGPFGEVVGEGPDGYGYAGEQWDHYIKMTYLRARYYQPETGRFVSRDQLVGNLAEPASRHRFAYVLDSPTRFRDPRGLYQEGEIEAFVSTPFFGLDPSALGPEPWLLEALNHPLLRILVARMQGRILPGTGRPGEFEGGTLSSLYQATRDEATALLSQDGVCGMTSLPLEAAHLSLIVLAGMAAKEHQPYRPKPVWEHYPVYLPDNRPVYEPGWDKTGHFFNYAFLAFEYSYSQDRGYPEAAELSGSIIGLAMGAEGLGPVSLTRLVNNLREMHRLASLFGAPYEPDLTIFDTLFGPYSRQDVEAFNLAATIGYAYEYLSTPLPLFQDIPWWTQKTGLPFEMPMVTQGVFDQGLWRDLTANKRGAKFGIQVYHDPFIVP